MFKYILSISLILLFIGCKQQPEYTIKHYQHINKDAVLNAAKKVLLLSDNEYSIDSYRNHIEASKDIAAIHGFNAYVKSSTINLSAIQEDEITKAKLTITTKKDFDKKDDLVSSTVHTLFWNRIEYILGLNNTWPTCLEHRLKLNFDGVFCDLLNNDNQLPMQSNIIRDSSIKKVIVEEDVKIKLAKIDTSVFNDIKLPFKNIRIDIIKEAELIDINDINNSWILPQVIQEGNITIISYKVNIKYKEKPIIIEIKEMQPEHNITIISYRTVLDVVEDIKIKPVENNTSDITPSKDFKSRFINANENYFTINLALALSEIEAIEFINKHKIKDDAFYIQFTKGKVYYKIMHGLFKDKNSALTALNKLSELLKLNSPTIEGVARKQELLRSGDIYKSKNIYTNNNIKDIEEVNLKTEQIKVIKE